MRVLVVTNLWPTLEAPARGGFVKDQVDALRDIDGVSVEVFPFGLGAREYVRAAAEIRRRYKHERFDVIHAHYGLCGWTALAARHSPHVVTFHGTDLAHPVVGPLSRALARRIPMPAPVSATLAAQGLTASLDRIAVLPCGVKLDRFKRMDCSITRARLCLEYNQHYLHTPVYHNRPY